MGSSIGQDMTKERISEHIEMSIEISKTEIQRGKRTKKTEWNTVDNYIRCNICVTEVSEEKTEEIFETIMNGNFSQLMIDTKP